MPLRATLLAVRLRQHSNRLQRCRPALPQLGTPFGITLEAPHVVDMRRQVWAGVVGAGPGGAPLVVSCGWRGCAGERGVEFAKVPPSWYQLPCRMSTCKSCCIQISVTQDCSPQQPACLEQAVPWPAPPGWICRTLADSPAPLQATYKNQCQTAFQDAVGRVVLDAAASIPDGLLVFMPSYSLLDRLVARWKVGGAGAIYALHTQPDNTAMCKDPAQTVAAGWEASWNKGKRQLAPVS